MKKIIDWFAPIHTVSEANCTEHFWKKKKRHDLQKKWIMVLFKKESPRCKVPVPCKIKLTRFGKRKLDSDNLPVSMKYVRDAIADQIFPGLAAGKADDDERIEWRYGQQISSEIGVGIEFFID